MVQVRNRAIHIQAEEHCIPFVTQFQLLNGCNRLKCDFYIFSNLHHLLDIAQHTVLVGRSYALHLCIFLADDCRETFQFRNALFRESRTSVKNLRRNIVFC